MFGWFKRRKRDDNLQRFATTHDHDYSPLADPTNTSFGLSAGSDSSDQDSSPCESGGDSGGFDGGGADCGGDGGGGE